MALHVRALPSGRRQINRRCKIQMLVISGSSVKFNQMLPHSPSHWQAHMSSSLTPHLPQITLSPHAQRPTFPNTPHHTFPATTPNFLPPVTLFPASRSHFFPATTSHFPPRINQITLFTCWMSEATWSARCLSSSREGFRASSARRHCA